MRATILMTLTGTLLLLTAGCMNPERTAVATATPEVNAHCDEYEGYPDCYPDHPLQPWGSDLLIQSASN
jgi:hypothetical protein